MTDEEARIAFACADCDFDTDRGHEYYFVQRETWLAHGAGDRMLCIGCLETRMGRALCRADFTPGFVRWVEVGHPTAESLKGRLRVSDRLRARIERV